MKVKFFTVKSKSERTSIYIRFWDSNRIDLKTKTGLTVNQSDWNQKRQEVKNNITATDRDFNNTKLRELRNFVLEKYNIDYNSNNSINENWLKNKVNEFFDRKDESEFFKVYFSDWIQKFIDEVNDRNSKGSKFTSVRIQRFKVVQNKFKIFEENTNKKFKFSEIDYLFYNSFLEYFRNIEKINDNTIGSYIKILKYWLKVAEIEGVSVNPYYKHNDFAAPSNKTKDVYLSENEINLIYNHDFSHSERLDNTRDNFIIGLRTGLRISDFLTKLKEFNISEEFIEIETTKTGENVVIPHHPQIKAILEKRGGKLPHKISDPKFNKYIKEVCQEVGIDEEVEGAKIENKKDEKDFFTTDIHIYNKNRKTSGKFPKYELITSHTCRRSFASNLYGKIPNLSIMAITGHKTEAQFLKYIKITPKEHAQKLKELWK